MYVQDTELNFSSCVTFPRNVITFPDPLYEILHLPSVDGFEHLDEGQRILRLLILEEGSEVVAVGVQANVHVDAGHVAALVHSLLTR